MFSWFQTATGAWHIPAILTVAGWLVGSIVTGVFIFANLKVSRDERVSAYAKEQQAQARVDEVEAKLRPRSISADQRKLFIDTTKNGPLGPVVLATRTALPDKEQEDFTTDLRRMLDAAGFGSPGGDVVNGFGTNIDPGQYLLLISNGSSPPPYFSNLASGLHAIGLISPDVPVAIKNPHATPGHLYLFIPEK